MFQKLISKNRNDIALPDQDDEQRLTRYKPEDERPHGSAHLTRFSRRHIREGAAQRVRDDAQVPSAETAAPVTAEPTVAPAQQGPDLDLYSDQPISINVLMRALPERFEKAQADISDAFAPQGQLRKLA